LRPVPGAAFDQVTHIQNQFGPQQVELRVDDNGPGIEQGILENVFEPYVSTKLKGSGLGMAIVKKIVEEHGGTIIADNNEAGGAQIRIRLMLVAAISESEPESHQQTSAHDAGL